MKNMNDLRNLLCEEIDSLKGGKTTAANVNAIVNATGKILSTIKMELEYAKLVGKQPKLDMILLTDKATIKSKPEKDTATN